MQVRLISVLILGFCIVSLVIGALNIEHGQEVQKICPAQPQPGLLKTFSAPGDKIALITLDGAISADSTSSFFKDYTSAENTLKSLQKAYEDKSVKAVILRINSPGGTVAMSQEIYNAVLKLRSKVPVVVSMADVAASGGYYIASAADRIYANPGTLTGSVGVIMQTMNAKGFLTDKLGLQSEVIKSGKYKDVGNIYRPLSQDEKDLLNNLIMNAYRQFTGAITKGRIERNDDYKIAKVELTKENLEKYADGRVFTGEQAIQYGFVDKLGGLSDVEDDVKDLIKNKDIPVVNYNKPTGFEEFFMQISEQAMPITMQGVEKVLPLSMKYPRQPLFVWE